MATARAATHPVTKKPFRKGMRDDVIETIEATVRQAMIRQQQPEPAGKVWTLADTVASMRADTTAPAPIISSKVDDCWDAVKDLSQLIDVLADRLNPVLLSDPPSSSSNSAEPAPDLSPLGHQLNGIENGVRGNISRLTALLSRLTL
jgi:hypothetical protein